MGLRYYHHLTTIPNSAITVPAPITVSGTISTWSGHGDGSQFTSLPMRGDAMIATPSPSNASSVTIKFRNMRSSKSPSKYCSKRASDMA